MSSLIQKTLLIPEKTDTERDTVAEAFQRLGGSVIRLGKFWEKPANLEGKQVCIYGNETFGQVVAQVFGVTLISPNDALIAHISPVWTKRIIALKTISRLTETDLPSFIKPVIPKQFTAKIYSTYHSFNAETNDLDGQTEIMVSEIVAIQAEARAFVLNNSLMDLALYEGSADLETGNKFLTEFINSYPGLPNAYVADIAYHSAKGWFILEFNACWGAGLNGCDPEKVIGCILEATQN